jgi:hypothetical protein
MRLCSPQVELERAQEVVYGAVWSGSSFHSIPGCVAPQVNDQRSSCAVALFVSCAWVCIFHLLANQTPVPRPLLSRARRVRLLAEHRHPAVLCMCPSMHHQARACRNVSNETIYYPPYPPGEPHLRRRNPSHDARQYRTIYADVACIRQKMTKQHTRTPRLWDSRAFHGRDKFYESLSRGGRGAVNLPRSWYYQRGGSDYF